MEELLRSPLVVRGVLIAPQLADAPRGTGLISMLRTAGIEIAEIPPLDFASAAETESPQGVLAVAEIPDRTLGSLSLGTSARIVVLDAVQDPGNVGTILRTAAALGGTAALALPGTVDLWNAKVIRSAMGASFHFPVLQTTWAEVDDFAAANRVVVWGADAGGTPLGGVQAPARLALVVGNEGAGLSPEARSRAAQLVALPTGPVVESLNVAVATGILLYQLRS